MTNEGDDPHPASQFLLLTRDALGAAGAASWRTMRAAANALQRAYLAIDPDARRHLLQLPLMGLTQLTGRNDELRPLPADGHLPLLFVHGLAGHPGNFGPMRLYFRMMGRTRSWSLGFPATGNLDTMALRLRDAIEQLAARNALDDSEKFQVVAHSMGGLLTRLALLDSRTAGRIRNVVTLGTPHQGTHAARFASTAETLALRPGSEVLSRIACHNPWPGPPTHPTLTAFWSEADLMILPATNATVPGARNVELPGSTHYSYLMDPTVWQATWETLSDGLGAGRPPQEDPPVPAGDEAEVQATGTSEDASSPQSRTEGSEDATEAMDEKGPAA